MSKKSNANSPQQPDLIESPRLHWALRACLWAGGLVLAGLMSILMVVGVAMVMAYPQLPDISDLADYRPKLPLRVYTADGVLMGEFGEERRNLTPIKEIPQVMKDVNYLTPNPHHPSGASVHRRNHGTKNGI